MTTKKQLTKTERLGRRLQLYVWAGLILLVIIGAVTNGKIPNQTLSFLVGTYFLLASIIGFETKVIFKLYRGFVYGNDSIFYSTLYLFAALAIYLISFNLQ